MKLCPSCGARYEDAAKFCQHDGTLLRTAGGGGQEEDPYIAQVLLGQLEVQELIGSGGMGRVYKARQLGFDRPVAVKILHSDLVTNQEMVKRFNREARIISRLDHPAIIHVYLFGELPDGNLYLAMEFVDGRPLTKLIAEGPVPPSRAVHIALQILSALEEAHGKGVVHRDLKPDNIMLVKRGADLDSVKVLDFGIAKFLGARTMLTQQGLVFGSARYISPEAAAGEDVDERADLYAVGVILYHMLAGEPPFDDASAVTLLMRHVNDQPPDLLGRPGARAVPPPLGTVVMRALEKDPASRHEDAATMRAALVDAAQRGGVVLPSVLPASVRSTAPPPAAQPPAARAAAEARPEAERPGVDTEGYGTNPMYGGRLGEIGAGAPAEGTASPSASSEPTGAATPKALAGGEPPWAAAPAVMAGTSAASGPFLAGGADSSAELDDDDDPPRLPRSRAWIVLVVVGLLALLGGASAALVAISGSGGGSPPAPPAAPSTEVPAVAEPPPVPAVVAATEPAELPAAEPASATEPAAEPTAEQEAAPADSGPAPGSGVGLARGGESPRPVRSGGSDSAGMPPSASLRVSPRRPRVGAAVRVVANVTPPSALRSARFVISRQGGGAASSHEAESGGEPGLYFLAHTFAEPGAYQITFVARSSHGELRAFAEASVTGGASPAPADPGDDEGATGPAAQPSPVSNSVRDEDKPPDDRTLEAPWSAEPTPVPPPLW